MQATTEDGARPPDMPVCSSLEPAEIRLDLAEVPGELAQSWSSPSSPMATAELHTDRRLFVLYLRPTSPIQNAQSIRSGVLAWLTRVSPTCVAHGGTGCGWIEGLASGLADWQRI